MKIFFFIFFLLLSFNTLGQNDVVLLNGSGVFEDYSFISNRDYSRMAIYGQTLSDRLDGIFITKDGGKNFKKMKNGEINNQMTFGYQNTFWLTKNKHLIATNRKNQFIHFNNGEWNKPLFINSNHNWVGGDKSLMFVDDKLGFVFYHNTTDIYKTNNGGRDWDKISNIDDNFPKFAHFIQSVYFYNEKYGIVYGNRYSSVMRNEYVGVKKMKDTKHNVNYVDIYLYQHNFTYGNYDITRKYSNFLYITKDGGKTWYETQLPKEFNSGKLLKYGRFYFNNEKNGYMFFMLENETTEFIFGETKDSGKTWIIDAKQPNKYKNISIYYRRDDDSFKPFVIHDFNNKNIYLNDKGKIK